MNATYVFGRIGRSNTVHMFEERGEAYQPRVVCGSNGWHHTKKRDTKLTKSDVTCKKCLKLIEAQEVERAHAADDAAGEAEYSEVMQEASEVMADEIYAVECFPSDAIKLLQQEIAKNRAELEALKADKSALLDERAWLLNNLYSNELKKYEAKFGKQPAPTAQAASEVAPVLAIEPIDEMGDGGFVWHEPKAPKKAVPTRCRVNWNQRGFSSGSYPVLGYSLEKQYYILDISTDCNRAMPKPVRFADCLAVQS